MSATELTRFQLDTAPVVLTEVPRRQLARVTPLSEDEFLHPGAIGIALGGFGLFLAASWVGWAFGYAALLIAVIDVLSIMYFGPMIECGQASAEFRGEVTHRSFGQFLAGQVQTFTGRISGSEALAQIAFMPIALGCLMCFFAVLWLSVRG